MEELLKFLACPICKSDLFLSKDSLVCCNDNCAKEYKIMNGIPILLPPRNTLTKDIIKIKKKWDERYIKGDGVVDDPLDDLYTVDSFKHIKKLWPYQERETPSGKIIREYKNNLAFLEAGCGTAKNAQLLAREGVKYVFGLDISYVALKTAKSHFQKEGLNGYFICGDLTRLPFKNSVFDFIFAGGSIEHFENTQIAVEGLRNILTKGGILSATVPLFCLSYPYSFFSGNIPDIPIIKQLCKFIQINILKEKLMMFGYEKSFTKRKIKRIFKNSGFQKIDIGFYETYYEFKFFKNKLLKKMAKKMVTMRPFWPVIYINGIK
ncbi:methyltransferase domain-containing protein [Patescibacteria group bacterium]|nr:methyltransferase domain-containing protein [Patescibacteria group bacterium]